MKINRRFLFQTIVFIALVIIAILNWPNIIKWVSGFWTVLFPIVLGGMMAYVLNILTAKFEQWWFPKSQNKWVNLARRPVSITLSLLVIFLIIAFTIGMVVPQLIGVVVNLLAGLPEFFIKVEALINKYINAYPEITGYLATIDIDWQNMLRNTLNVVQNVSSNLINTTLSTVTSIAGWIVNLFLAIIVAFYILMSKEKLGQQFTRLTDAYLSRERSNRLHYFIALLDDAFYNFITGEVVEAVILGCMVGFGMWMFSFPYASMVGVLTGVTALIPLLGAYISGAVGFFLILMESPTQAIYFVIFLVIVQQIEGNLIYPRVVGNSLGLPGLWVLVAVTVGGGLLGVGGMVIGVPVAAAFYRMISEDVAYRELKAQADITSDVMSPAEVARAKDFNLRKNN
ncbi:hypothetical protein AWM75_04555 [Aerococcus urinaehominis]|uniref:Uncharacterized protein n=1 Tax=Aerococcus urinaehominis TaxID=128944 RepID=A0A0X8FL45_9LACT|nr:AI-2E family transporter [Aerococcus urinaehominis]AMB99317.1 hypothetical protein AWM75_04555 [Aerococcus urinaehominis]SDM20087.1 Predicted PurR-regulated permease PerM [Aerococcus urinaehominis]